MFDIGFTEMMLIGIVALVVIGPERLPGVARTAGKYFSRLRSFVSNVRADVESELKADELREMFDEQQKELQSLKEVVGNAGKNAGLSDISNEMSDLVNTVGDESPKSSVEPEDEAISAAKDKPVTRAAVKSKSRAKAGVKPKTAAKLKPKASPKTNTRANPKADAASESKAESGWTGGIAAPAATAGSSRTKAPSGTAKVSKTRAKAAKPAAAKAK